MYTVTDFSGKSQWMVSHSEKDMYPVVSAEMVEMVSAAVVSDTLTPTLIEEGGIFLTIRENGYGWTGHKSSSGFSDLAPSILHYNWF
jgi:hypothetical protein